MLLCVDIGNTNIKLGLFDDEQLIGHWRIATDRARLAAEYAMLLLNLLASENFHPGNVSDCTISSVVPPLTQEFVELSRRYLNQEPVVIGPGIRTSMVVNTDYPAEGNFEGVAIAPGIGAGGEALFRSTARLPQVELARPPYATGKNTIHSMQSGLIFGFAGLVDALVERLRREWGEGAQAIATGGLAELIAGETNVIAVVEPNLTLIGLKLIYALNKDE